MQSILKALTSKAKSMKKVTSFLTLLTLAILGFGCQEGTESESEESTEGEGSFESLASPDMGKSLLYEISGNGLKQPSYLFGTIHMIESEDFFLPENMESIFDRVDRLVLEIDMDDPGMMMEAATIAQIEGDSTLEMMVTEEEYAMMDAFFKEEIGIGVGMLSTMKPFFVYGLLAESYLEDYKQYEKELMNMASEREMEVLGLETLDYLNDLINEIPLKEQAKMLVEGVMEYDSGVVMFKDMVGLYKDQDVDGLYEFVSSEMTEYEKFEGLLLADRNAYWLEGMKTMMSEAPTLFAVGAGHLGGESGVIALLKAAGYEVQPVK